MKQIKINSLKIMLLFASTLLCTGCMNSKYLDYEKALNNELFNEYGALKVINYENYTIDDYVVAYDKPKFEYENEHLSYLEIKDSVNTVKKHDLNSDGHKELIIYARNEKVFGVYIIIAVENKKSLDVTKVIFKKKVLHAFTTDKGYGEGNVIVCYQYGSDWCDRLYWDGKDYILEEDYDFE